MKWCDLLRVKSEFPINLWPNAVQAYARWIRTAVAENMPYDQFARKLLTASGSCFRVPEANFYRAVQNREPEGIAQAVGLTFLGARKPPAGMAAFFAKLAYKKTGEWKEEIVYHAGEGPDPREAFVRWLLAPANPWFARNAVNRVWSRLLGRGIVHEPDDFRPGNPPSHPELLEYLAAELVKSRYDLKHIYRLILNSQVYQLSPVSMGGAPAQFASYPVRRLDAEVLIDAVCRVTGTGEEYWSPIPEPFTYLPENQRSIAVADGSITSSFLEMFGRPPRDTGLESERNNAITAEQRLHLLNSSHIQLKIQQSTALRDVVQSGRGRAPIDRLYLTILSRYPTDQEAQTASAYFQGVTGSKWPAVVDLVWALINSAEFLYRH